MKDKRAPSATEITTRQWDETRFIGKSNRGTFPRMGEWLRQRIASHRVGDAELLPKSRYRNLKEMGGDEL